MAASGGVGAKGSTADRSQAIGIWGFPLLLSAFLCALPSGSGSLKVKLNSWEIYGRDLGCWVWAWQLFTGPPQMHTATLCSFGKSSISLKLL